MVQHILSGSHFSRSDLDELFARTDYLLGLKRKHIPHVLADKAVAVVFYEPSTRTFNSFQRATQLLGGHVIATENAGIVSSAFKGETVEDTVRTLEQLEVDAIVLRHKEAGMSRRASEAASIPVINAGDGGDEHPTQALLDLYTVLQHVRGRSEVTITLCGDLGHSRTVRSLCRLLIRYAYGEERRFRLILCSPRDITRLGDDVRAELATAGITYEETGILPRAMRQCDVFYQTRVQRERFPDGMSGDEAHRVMQEKFSITTETISHLNQRAVILHPLPRTGEISPLIDLDPRAWYFRQIRNGLYIRMALLEQLLGDPA